MSELHIQEYLHFRLSMAQYVFLSESSTMQTVRANLLLFDALNSYKLIFIPGLIVHIIGEYHTHRGDPLRTNIVLDEELVREAQKLTALPTKKAVVDEALRTLIRLKKQQAILSLRGKIQWRGDLNASRTGRHGANDH